MSCALTQGYTLGCNDGIGGIRSIRIIEFEYLSTITASSASITAITLLSSKKFWKYQLPSMNKDYWSEPLTPSQENGGIYYPQEVQLTIRKMSNTLRNEIRLIAQNRLAMIVEDNAGKFWLIGQENGIELSPSTAGSGAGRGEFNGYVLKFNGEANTPAQEVASSIIDALTN